MNSRYMPDRIELASLNAEMTTLLWVMQEGSPEQEVLKDVDSKEVEWIKDADRREVINCLNFVSIVLLIVGLTLIALS